VGTRGEVSYVPTMRTQLVSARMVAQALADLATSPESSPPAPTLEIAGPREEDLVEMARLLVSRRGDPVKIEGVSDPANPETDLYQSRALLPGPDATLAGPTFAQWLDATSGSAAA
jgi:uncharacterized protein YbjT (DUF2867 family)